MNIELQFLKQKLLGNRLNGYREIATPNKTPNEHVYAIVCRPEVAGDVISGEM